MKKDVHITNHPSGGFHVKTAGSSKAYRITPTQKSAIKIGREMAKHQHSELVIHGTNGKIRQKNSYGNDPYPPKG